jgi:hypothetical protein
MTEAADTPDTGTSALASTATVPSDDAAKTPDG